MDGLATRTLSRPHMREPVDHMMNRPRARAAHGHARALAVLPVGLAEFGSCGGEPIIVLLALTSAIAISYLDMSICTADNLMT